jgi:hypothetical protein
MNFHMMDTTAVSRSHLLQQRWCHIVQQQLRLLHASHHLLRCKLQLLTGPAQQQRSRAAAPEVMLNHLFGSVE